MKRCAIYIRVSTEEQHLNGLSLPAQKNALEEYAARHEYTVVGVYADEGISARKAMKNRPGLMMLLEDVKANKIDMILVTKLDRWFRNIKDYNITEEILEAHNCHWKTIFENYDSSTANGQMVINIMLSVNQAECDRTSERIKAVFDYKRKNGEHITGKPAFGYKTVDKKLVKNEDERPIVEDFFQHYLKNLSKNKSIQYIVSKYGDAAPNPQTLEKIFKREVYCGMRGDDTEYCEPYITKEQFDFIQSVCSSRTYPHTNEPYIFSQLIKCPHCGARMTGFKKTHYCKDGSKRQYKRYRCSKKFAQNHPGGACITEHVIEEYMIEHVCPELNRILYTFETQENEQKKVIDNTPRIKAELDRLNLLFQKGRITVEYYDSQYEELDKKLKACQKKKMETPDDYKHIREQFSGNWLEVYDKLDVEHKNTFWKRTIKDIYIDKDSHKICGFTFLTHGCSK